MEAALIAFELSVLVIIIAVFLLMLNKQSWRFYNQWYAKGEKDKLANWYWDGIELGSRPAKAGYKDGFAGRPRKRGWIFGRN